MPKNRTPHKASREAEIRARLTREEREALERLRARVLAAVALYRPAAPPIHELDLAFLEAADKLVGKGGHHD